MTVARTAADPLLPDRAGTLGQRLRAALISAASAIACRLPEPPLVRLAEAAGEAWYILDPRRAARGRRNLRRVCAWLAAEGLGPERARRAATDDRALVALTRAASRHHARYYLEVLRAPALTAHAVTDRLSLDEPAAVDGMLAAPGALIVVGMHFGALEVPAVYLADRVRRPAVAPMETLADPPLQRWFERTRGGVGVHLVPIAAARRELLAALERGEIAGLIADRDIGGGGIPVPLFGHPAPLPIGAALLVMESGAPAIVAAVRRLGGGRYRARIVRLEPIADGPRRERVTAFLTAQAAAFQGLIADAPDQWWAAFFPIWPDLEAGGSGGSRPNGGGGRPDGGRSRPTGERSPGS
ncbi:MAG TPA: lysophospholipid acyltransferase family protein [Candidatus Limnocylindrales bacterium]